MTFYNKKEEVIEIKLTSHGKYLHSKGKLKPAYYSFFDDDVVYDGAHGSSDDPAHDRIKHETPRSRIQYNTSGVSTVSPEEEVSVVERTGDRDIKQPLGTSAAETVYHPSWKSYMLQGELDSSEEYMHKTDSAIVNIPQMNVKKRMFTVKSIRGTDDNSSTYGITFPDGSSVTLKEGEDSEFLLYLKEENSPSGNKNFDMEFFIVDDTGDNEELIPLEFMRSQDRFSVVDGLLVENETVNEPDLNIQEGEQFVEHYFDVKTDRQIDPDLIAKALAGRRFADIRDLESFSNMMIAGDGTDFNSGNFSTELYDLTLDEISAMSDEILNDLGRRAEGLYDLGDDTSDC